MKSKNIAAIVALAVLAALIYVVYTSKECRLQRVQAEGLVR